MMMMMRIKDCYCVQKWSWHRPAP